MTPETENTGSTTPKIHDAFLNRECNNDTVGGVFEGTKSEASIYMDALDDLEKVSPSTIRYLKLAKTALEESVMWATKAIALSQELNSPENTETR